MKRIQFFELLIILSVFISSCTTNNFDKDIEKLKSEILQTEKNFALTAKENGVKNAFLRYAAEDAVLNRNNSILKGKVEIGKYFDNLPYKEVKLEWEPDFIDVSSSGDLAYTYGYFVFSALDTNGQIINAKGIFHTVWKKQKDGTWKYVWD